MFGDHFSAWWRRLFLGKSAPLTGGRQLPRQPIPLGLETLEDRLTPTVVANDLYVATLYDGLLGRAATTSEISYWSARLTIGSSAVAHDQVALGIANSAEALSRDVQLFYSTYLLRAPDVVGQAYWVQQLENGATLNQVRAGFLGSAEFFALSGGTNQTFLDAVYHLELGRTIDSAGLAYWTQQLTTNHESRTTVLNQILANTEANNTKTSGFYQDILGRSGDATGVGFWSSQLSAGTPELSVVSGFLSSNEFINDIQAFAGSTTMTTATGAATQFIGNSNLFTGPLPNAEELAGNVATSRQNPFIIANNDFYNVGFNTSLGVTNVSSGLLANDIDSAGLSLHVTNPGTYLTPKGSIQVQSNGTFVYMPQGTATGTDTFTYTASDANNISNSATVTFTIANPVPIAVDAGYNIPFDGSLTINNPSQGILANDSDPDGEHIAVTNPGLYNTTKGTFKLNADGTFIYTANGGQTGQDSFSYTVSDPSGTSLPATVYFTLEAPNGALTDRYEPNQTSDTATNFGSLPFMTPQIYSYLNINNTAAGLPDYDWYTWTASQAGTFNATINTTTGGPLQMHIFTVQNGTLQEQAGTSSGELSVGLTAGQTVYVEVLGQSLPGGTSAQGTYNLTVSLTQ